MFFCILILELLANTWNYPVKQELSKVFSHRWSTIWWIKKAFGTIVWSFTSYVCSMDVNSLFLLCVIHHIFIERRETNKSSFLLFSWCSGSLWHVQLVFKILLFPAIVKSNIKLKSKTCIYFLWKHQNWMQIYSCWFAMQGYALLCVGFPSSDIEVETQDEDEVMSIVHCLHFQKTYSMSELWASKRK